MDGTSTATAGTDVASRPLDRRVLLASGIGTAVEYFDFSSYGYLATIIAAVFFSTGDSTSALLATLLTFAAAFVLRPFGGIIFGHFGDRLGRQKALATSVILMAVASFLIGVLPTYAAIGVGATALLVITRCIQGIATGGEMPGAGSYLAETAAPERRALAVSFAQLGTYSGALAASLLVALLTNVLNADQMHSFGWRVPFLIALPLGVVGLYIRTRLEDTEQFEEVKASGQVAKAPLAEVIARHPLALVRTFGLCVLTFASYYIAFVYTAIYLQREGGFSASAAFWSTALTLAVSCATMPLAGLIADRLGRKAILISASAGFLVLSYPLFLLLEAGGAWPYLAHIVIGILAAAMSAVAFTAFVEIYPARVRYSGIALSMNLSSMAVGGSAPAIATWLISTTGNPAAPAFFLMAAALITLVTIATMKEGKGIPLPS